MSAMPGGGAARALCVGLALAGPAHAVERAAAAAPGAAPSPARCADPAVHGRVAALAEEGAALRLASGEVLRAADIRLAAGTAGQRGRAWLGALVGREVGGRAGDADRWGIRRAAGLVLADETPPIDVAELLVAEGYAIVDPGEADALCAPGLLAVEAKARERRLGAWRDDAVLDGRDAAAVEARVGAFAVVEGVVTSVGERPARAYLNFGRAGSGALTVTLPKRGWAELKRRGLSAEILRGRRVRARGTIERWRGPMLEVVASDVLELLDDAPAARPR